MMSSELSMEHRWMTLSRALEGLPGSLEGTGRCLFWIGQVFGLVP